MIYCWDDGWVDTLPNQLLLLRRGGMAAISGKLASSANCLQTTQLGSETRIRAKKNPCQKQMGRNEVERASICPQFIPR